MDWFETFWFGRLFLWLSELNAKEHGSLQATNWYIAFSNVCISYKKNFFFFFVFKDKVICLLVRQSQYTVITYRGLHKKYKYETLVKADSFDVRKEFLGITCGMGGGEMRTPSKRKSDKSFETCRLNNLGSPVLSAGQFFRREIASFLFRCAQPKRG